MKMMFQKIDFRNRYGYIKVLVMPFWVTNAPTAFIELMNRISRPKIDHFVVVFIDNILIYSEKREKPTQHLKNSTSDNKGSLVVCQEREL